MEETILLLKNLYIETTDGLTKDEKTWEDKQAVLGKLAKLRDIFNAFDEIKEQDEGHFECSNGGTGVLDSLLTLATNVLDLIRDNVKKDVMKMEEVRPFLYNIQDMLDYL